MSMSAPTASASPPASPIKMEGSPTLASPLNSELGTPPAADGPPKRKTTRCAKTAERHATHNAAERMRRETLNRRFLTPTSILPPPEQGRDRWGVGWGVRRGVMGHACARRAQGHNGAVIPTLCGVLHAACPSHSPSAIPRFTVPVLPPPTCPLYPRPFPPEVNEWRLRARILPLAMPPRSDAHAEVEDCDLVLEEGLDLEADAEDEGGEEDAPAHVSSFSTHKFSPPRSAARTCAQQHQAPAAAAGGGRGPGGADFCVRIAAHAHVDGTAGADGDAGDAPVRPDADADARVHRIGVRADPDERAGAGYDAPVHSGVGYDLDLDLDLGLGLGLGFPASASPAEEMMMMGMGGGGGWVGTSSQHPAFQHAHSHHQHQQQQQYQQQMQLRELQRQQAQMQQYLVQQQQQQRAEYEQQMGTGVRVP
ncbi:hypothetical protein B0H17DRAFT_1145375 [Mycena rosella]|uniref:BHLH domain-containing protein n=1 Tax=Mycena rosella TaxID=1033263 RepID=A0AAD7CRD8_MYCRO|nr:hypothetical protein B0H17DRAFT_1145375 [Mycena rosella]